MHDERQWSVHIYIHTHTHTQTHRLPIHIRKVRRHKQQGGHPTAHGRFKHELERLVDIGAGLGRTVLFEEGIAFLGDVGLVRELDAVVADGAEGGEDQGKVEDLGVFVCEKEGVVFPFVVDEELLEYVDPKGGVAQVGDER